MPNHLSPLLTPLGHATQLPIECFLQHVLPPLPHDVHPTKILDYLLHAENFSAAQRPITQKGRWRGFPTDPAQMKTTQRQVFRRIENVVSAVLHASGSSVTPKTISFLHNSPPRQTKIKWTEDFLPELCLFRGETASWSSMVTFGDLRKTATEKDAQENRAKITWSMANCIAKDPRRRFVYAFSIENTDMRLWFCDRSKILVSETHNFILNHLPLVHFILSVAHAQDIDLGLDPTVIPVKDSQQYDITVCTKDGESKTYRTMEMLACREPQALFGRGTRVWKAVQVQDGREVGNPVALKDAWVDFDMTQEGKLLEQVQLADRSQAHEDTIDNRLLTVDCHGDVAYNRSSGTVLDHTLCFTESGVRLDIAMSSREQLAETFTSSAAAQDDPGSEGSSTKLMSAKCLVHYRIVFRELCTPLSDETSLPAIFKALARITLTLKRLHLAGWVHRDVSDRNVLLQAGLARLSDLEFAKEIGVGKDTILGTADFISGEIELQLYRFVPGFTPPTTPNGTERHSPKPPSLSTVVDSFELGTQREPPTFPAIRYNPLHDLESLWWIAVYFTVNKEVFDSAKPETQEQYASAAQRTYALTLFGGQHLRQITFEVPHYLLTNTSSLPPMLSPIIKRLDKLRYALISQYHVAERNLETLGRDAAGDLYQTFHNVFQSIAEAQLYRNTFVRPFTPVHIMMKEKWSLIEDEIVRENLQSRYPLLRLSPIQKPHDDDAVQTSSQAEKRHTEDDVPSMFPRRNRPYLPRQAKSRRECC